MIIEKETERYKVYPKKLIDSTFTSAYDSNNDAPVVMKPDLIVLIFSIFSLLLIVGMCALTWYHERSGKAAYIWLCIGAIFLVFIFTTIKKYVKQLKLYKNDNSKGAVKYDTKSEFSDLFPSDLPNSMTAADFALKINGLVGKQKKDVYNNALRNLITKLNKINNPDDILCKNLSLYGNIMDRLKQRFYITIDDGKLVVYDAAFQNPKGELIIDIEDIVKYDEASEFDTSAISKSGIKASNDGILIEINAGEGNENIFLEIHSKDFERFKKMIKTRKVVNPQ